VTRDEAERLVRNLEGHGKPQPGARAALKPMAKSICTKKPNRNEQNFFDEILFAMKSTGQYATVMYEGRSFPIFTIRYTPDWVCTRPDGTVVCYEVKPYYRNLKRVHWHPGSRERLKVAAGMYPAVEFIAAWKSPAGWMFENIGRTK